MSSFCLEFLVIVGRLSRYITSPDPVFISGCDNPFVNDTPRFIILDPEGLVVIPVKLVSIVPENPKLEVIGLELEIKFKTLEEVETPT